APTASRNLILPPLDLESTWTDADYLRRAGAHGLRPRVARVTVWWTRVHSFAMTDPLQQLRDNVAAAPPTPAGMAPYLDQVRDRADTATDADGEGLKKAGSTEAEIFEQTVATATGEGLRRLDAALEVIT